MKGELVSTPLDKDGIITHNLVRHCCLSALTTFFASFDGALMLITGTNMTNFGK